MRIYSTTEIRKIMEATQEVAAYAQEETPHQTTGAPQEIIALIDELESESKFKILLRSIERRMPRL